MFVDYPVIVITFLPSIFLITLNIVLASALPIISFTNYPVRDKHLVHENYAKWFLVFLSLNNFVLL